jgi:CheY-like chemotaxis protein
VLVCESSVGLDNLHVVVHRIGPRPLPRANRTGAPMSARPLAVTGMSSDEHLERVLAAGFSYFLIKPADPNELMRLLRTCADESGCRGER